jgi:C4-dicarboxylate transporter DctQ subunit
METSTATSEAPPRPPWYVHVEDVLGTLALGTILIVMGAQIVLRYVFNDSLIWSEEVSRYLLITLVFLGAAAAVREREHIAIDLIDWLVPPQILSAVKRLADALLAAYLLIVVYHAFTVVKLFSSQPSSALQVPMAIPYAAIPIGFALTLWRLAGLYLGQRKGGAT